MSTIKDLEQYIGKKDLSKTAKDNIVKIFCDLDGATAGETVAMLLRFPQDVIGNYLTQAFGKKSDAEKAEIIALIKKVEPLKLGHLFRAFCSLIALGDIKGAFDLLCARTEKDLIGKDINKQIFQGFDKTVRDCTFKPFVQKFDEDKKRHLNIFAAFLLKYFDYSKNDKIIPQIIDFYTLNGLQIPQDITTVPVTDTDTQDDKKAPEKKVAAKKPMSFEELLEAAAEKYKELIAAKTAQDEQFKTAESELKKCRADLLSKTTEASDLRSKLMSLQSQHESTKETLAREQAELERVRREKAELEKANADLKARLANIASGYGAAGQQEMDSLKGKLASRLKVSFDKFIEIKEKQPDLDYYEVLIFILDEIQKTLKKHGIEI